MKKRTLKHQPLKVVLRVPQMIDEAIISSKGGKQFHDGVQYVKGLKNNLFSIGQFNDLECKIHTEGEILKVEKDNLVMMKVDKIMTNLYMLLGDTLQEANA
ncbi:hypothetical protein CR513_47779, partial [Mucuna pruriens]